MKKRYLLIAAILVVAMMAMGACKRTGLVMNSTSEKSMTVEAGNDQFKPREGRDTDRTLWHSC